MAEIASAPKRRENLEAIVQSNSPYHVQNWYKILKDHTFETVFLPLPVELAEAITSYKDKTITADADMSLARKFAPKIPLTVRQTLEKRLAEVAALIDAAKANLRSDGLFVRLSSRSPKDMISVRLYASYLSEMRRELAAAGGSAEDQILQKIIFTRASGLALRVADGADAVALLVNSQRVYEDLAMSLKLYKGAEWSQELVVRRWESINQEWEFRAFVYNGRLTACTHYYNGVYVPLLVATKAETAQRIQDYWAQSIHPLLAPTVQTYVVDFAVEPPPSKKIWVVEINNPPPVAGTALFDWNNPIDRNIIENGPFEFRILGSAPEEPMKNQRQWLKSMEALYAKNNAKEETDGAKKRLSF